jgi:hypothetical protein
MKKLRVVGPLLSMLLFAIVSYTWLRLKSS